MIERVDVNAETSQTSGMYAHVLQQCREISVDHAFSETG